MTRRRSLWLVLGSGLAIVGALALLMNRSGATTPNCGPPPDPPLALSGGRADLRAALRELP